MIMTNNNPSVLDAQTKGVEMDASINNAYEMAKPKNKKSSDKDRRARLTQALWDIVKAKMKTTGADTESDAVCFWLTRYFQQQGWLEEEKK